MNNNAFIGIIIVIIVLFTGMTWYFGNKSTSNLKDALKNISVINADDHVTWNKDGKNIIVEYSDLQCPACSSFYKTMQTWYSDENFVKAASNSAFVYRHFPLPQHKHAMFAAKAAEAAGRQNKFFEFADLAFTTQSNWENLDNPTDLFINYANKLGLDTVSFEKDLKDSSLEAKIIAQQQIGTDVGINSTPSFFVNGKKVDARSYNDIKTAILEANK